MMKSWFGLRRYTYKGARYQVMHDACLDEQVLETLHELRQNAWRLASRIPDSRVRCRFERRLRNSVFVEYGPPVTSALAHTINKGQRLELCLRTPDGREFHPRSSTTLVFVHELAHMMSESVGHTPEFHRNHAWALGVAEEDGWYDPKGVKAVEHCGVTIPLR